MSKALDIADYGQYPPVRKNLLINGNFDVWQRGTSFAAITNDDYSSDRWKWGFSGSMVTTMAFLKVKLMHTKWMSQQQMLPLQHLILEF
jgi:hypothetical protein